jgi:GTPase
MQRPVPTRCGTIAIVGKPNVGKSTLLNALVGEKLAIVSPKPQATRCPVVAIRTETHTQLIFVDHPGILSPTYLLQRAMVEASVESVRGADAILYLHPFGESGPPSLATVEPLLADLHKPVATVLAKADQAVGFDRSQDGSVHTPEFVVCAVTGAGLDPLVAWCRDQVPEGPFRYDREDVSTQPVRFFIAEFVREAAYDLLHEELPYAIAAEVDEYREGSDPLYIRVTMYVERPSQKPMVIGAAGKTIRALGMIARQRIESLVDQRVYLDLWVKVLPRWRSNQEALARFGLPIHGVMKS